MAVATGTSTFSAAPSSVAGAVATWTGVSIGTASADRLVVLCVGTEFASGTITSATIDFGSGDTAMTAASQGTLGSDSARIFYLAVSSGTTATFKVTYGANPSTTTTWAAAYAVTGVGANPVFGSGAITDTDADPITSGIITIPSNGALIAIASFAADASARTWTGATEDVDTDAGTFQFTTATNTTGGETTITVSGANTEDCALSYIQFFPAPSAFGDRVGSAVGGATSIPASFSPDKAITISVGDLVVVTVCEQIAISATACGDNLGNSYTALTNGTIGIAYYSVATVGGACTPAVTCTSSTHDGSIAVVAYKGPFASPVLDKNPAVLSDAAEPYSANATGTLSQADELIVGYFNSFSNETNYDTPAPSARLDTQSIALNGSAASSALTSLVVSATTTLTMTLSGTVGNRTTDCGVATFKKGSGNKTITASGGSYSLTGIAATLTLGHRTGIQSAGSYALTGINATLTLGHRSGLEDAGSYALAGSAAGTIHTWKSTADSSSYALSGVDATLAKGQRTAADAGLYSLTGTDASILLRRKLIADATSYSINGTDATLTRNIPILASPGSYSISGGDVSVKHGWLLQTDSGSYIFTGTDAAFRRSTVIKPDSGTYSLTGTDASLLKSWKLGADAGSYAVNGSNADLLIRSDKFIGANSGSYIVSGTTATLINNKLIVVGSGTYLIDGQAAGIIPSGAATTKGFRGLLAFWMGGASGITKATRGLSSLLAFWMGGGGAAAEQISLPYSGPPPPKRIIVINGVVPGEEFVIRFSVNPGLAVASGLLAASASGGAMTKEALVLAQNAIKSGFASGEKNLTEEEIFILSQIV